MSTAPAQKPLFEGVAEGDPPRPRRSAPRGSLMDLCVLGSGSGGNCTVLRVEGRAMLIDLGFGPRTTQRRLAQARLTLDDVRAVCLTHLDRDHFRPSWVGPLLERGVAVHLHRWHRPDLLGLPGGRALDEAGGVRWFEDEPFEPMKGLWARGVRCQHDRQGTIGYRLDAEAGSVGYATDLGHVPPALIEHLAGVDLLALECNYDERMTLQSSRPSFVKRRNLSDSGHLSNEQALEAVGRVAAASPAPNPRHVVLLHRSTQCNHPMKVRRVFARAPHLARRITLTEQRRRTRWLSFPPLRRVRREQYVLRY